MIKNSLSFFIFCTLLFFSFLLPASVTLIEDKALLPILTPAFSERQTAKLKLENGLQAYLVSDPRIDKSSAALTVKTGSWEDPVEYPGIAHFLEHMLFLGNKKYPNEAEYDQFMTEHGGQFNAFTANDFTGYVFTIDHSALPEALDRFSNFFKEPLFNPSGVDRELHAIDQEYAKNIENDDIREYFIHKELSNPGHPNIAFSMGNRESLQKVSQETLKEWYKKHYSANRMVVEVISTIPLKELKTLVIKDFSGVPTNDSSFVTPTLSVISEASKGHMIYIDPVKNLRRLVILWELPFKFAAMRDTKPELLICHVLGDEGKNSLIAELKKEKLGEGLQCEAQKLGGNSFLMALQVDLTDAGVKNINKVILRCFEALSNLKKKGIPNYLVEELQTMTTLNYQYQPRKDAFEHIFNEATQLPYEDLSTYPEQSQTFQSYDAAATQELLQFLTPENGIFELMAPKSLTGIAFESKEKWLGVSYTIKKIPEETLAAWKNAVPNSKIDLPESNPYLPETISLLNVKDLKESTPFSFPHPVPLLDSNRGKIYFSEDVYYSVPSISWAFEIKTPAIHPANVDSGVLADLFVKQAAEALSPYVYPASIGGLNFSILPTNHGLSVGIDGYSDKSQALFLDLVKALKTPQVREQKFKTYKELLLREYQNNSLDIPLIQANEQLLSILYKNFNLSKAKSAALRKITFEQFQNFCVNIFEKTYVEGLLYGNINQSQAEKVITNLIATLASAPYPKNEQHKDEIIILPRDQGPFFIETKSTVQGNAAILAIAMDHFSFNLGTAIQDDKVMQNLDLESLLMGADHSLWVKAAPTESDDRSKGCVSLPSSIAVSRFKERAAQQVLMQAIKEPFFSTLRTRQQTGYIVLSKAEELEQHLFDIFAVQSNTHEGRDLLARFELFIEDFLQELSKKEVPKKRFENIRKALLTAAKQPPQSISEMSALLYKLAFSYHGDFDRVAKRIKAFENLSYEEFLEFAKHSLGKENKQRIAIIFTGSTPEENLKYRKLCNSAQLKKLSTYEPAYQDLLDE